MVAPLEQPVFAHGTELYYGEEGDGDGPAIVWSKVDRIQDFNVPFGQRDELDVTDHDSGGSEETIAGLRRTGEMSFSAHYIARNDSHRKLKELHDTGQVVPWRVILTEPPGSEEDEEEVYFDGWIRQFELTNPVNGARVLNTAIRITGVVESSLDAGDGDGDGDGDG